jgi:hypothetical protein
MPDLIVSSIHVVGAGIVLDSHRFETVTGLHDIKRYSVFFQVMDIVKLLLFEMAKINATRRFDLSGKQFLHRLPSWRLL